MASVAKRLGPTTKTEPKRWIVEVRGAENWFGIDGETLDTLYLPIIICRYESGMLALDERVMSGSNKKLLGWVGLDIPHR